jgi:mannose/fructose/N-acetylgalactosamine-specific phosphotransferase system component IID
MKKGLILLKSLFFTANQNITNMQGTGYKYLIDEVSNVNNINIDNDISREQLGYFNSHPFMINFIVGMWFKEYLNKGEPDYFKKVYSSALAALGDSFFWHTLRPLSFLLSAILALYEPVIGLIFYFVFFNVFHIFFLWIGFDAGFKLGKEVIGWFNRIKFNTWPKYGDAVSVFCFGILLSMLIKTNIGFQIDLLVIVSFFVALGFLFAKRLDVTLGLIIALILLLLIVYVRGA